MCLLLAFYSTRFIFLKKFVLNGMGSGLTTDTQKSNSPRKCGAFSFKCGDYKEGLLFEGVFR